MSLPKQYYDNLQHFEKEREMSPKDFEYVFGTEYSHKRANHALRAMYAELDNQLKKQTGGKVGLKFKIVSGGWNKMEEVSKHAGEPHEFPVIEVLMLTPYVLGRKPFSLDELMRDPDSN